MELMELDSGGLLAGAGAGGQRTLQTVVRSADRPHYIPVWKHCVTIFISVRKLSSKGRRDEFGGLAQVYRWRLAVKNRDPLRCSRG